jgi:hypothetical protein
MEIDRFHPVYYVLDLRHRQGDWRYGFSQPVHGCRRDACSRLDAPDLRSNSGNLTELLSPVVFSLAAAPAFIRYKGSAQFCRKNLRQDGPGAAISASSIP